MSHEVSKSDKNGRTRTNANMKGLVQEADYAQEIKKEQPEKVRPWKPGVGIQAKTSSQTRYWIW